MTFFSIGSTATPLPLSQLIAFATSISLPSISNANSARSAVTVELRILKITSNCFDSRLKTGSLIKPLGKVRSG